MIKKLVMINDYTQFQYLCKKLALPHIFGLFGEEKFLISESLMQIKNMMFADIIDVNYDCLDGSKISFHDMMNSVNIVSFNAKKKIVIIRYAEKLSNIDFTMMNEYINIPNTRTCLIFVFESNINNNTTFIYLKNKIKFFNFAYLNKNELYNFIVDRMKIKKLILNKSVISMLMILIHNNLILLESILNKLQLLPSNIITLKDLHNNVYNNNVDYLFILVKYIICCKIKESLRILSKVFLLIKSPFKLIYLLAFQFRLIIKVKYMLSNHLSLYVIKQKYVIYNVDINVIISIAQKYSMMYHCNRLIHLSKLDLFIKTQQCHNIWLILERTIIVLCNVNNCYLL